MNTLLCMKKILASLDALNEIASIAQDRNEKKDKIKKIVETYTDLKRRMVMKQQRKGEVFSENSTHNYILRSRGQADST